MPSHKGSAKYWEDQYASLPVEQPVTPPQEAPVDDGDWIGQYRALPEPGAAGTPLRDVAQGAAQGTLDVGQQTLQDIAGDRTQPPGSLSEMIGQIPGAAIDLMTGGKGGEMLRRLDLSQYGPGVPPTPEGQLGAELAPAVPGVLGLGGMAARGGARAISQRIRGGPEERALAERLSEEGRPREAYVEDVMGEAYPRGPGATKAQADAVFEQAELAPGQRQAAMSPKQRPPAQHLDINQPPPTQPRAPRVPQVAYRNRIKKLLNDATGHYISPKIGRMLMADDGMTVRQYYKTKQIVGAHAKAPSGKIALMNETPVAKQTRRAYAEAANALDEMPMPPGNAAVEMYGEGRELWRVFSNYDKAKGMVAKFLDTSPSGADFWNARAFQKALNKMNPDDVSEIFGPNFAKVIKLAKRVTHRGFKAKQKAKEKSRLAVWRKLRNWGLLGGIGYTSSRMVSDVRTQVVGAPMVRKHSDR